ncbi:hypothetical protein CCP3SC15_6550003 [Gammaproteobacteria bacterium]
MNLRFRVKKPMIAKLDKARKALIQLVDVKGINVYLVKLYMHSDIPEILIRPEDGKLLPGVAYNCFKDRDESFVCYQATVEGCRVTWTERE